ncbi:MAG: hypothetical protein NC111_06595 [Bacteroides sp.]|nr:hypothetical protein [Bacteroides sp.]MCM1413085.1 hypothetical protein [Bacteroides sp.]MCM1472173.1 hypothetical protein [Bacteroides sp.]
MLPASLSFWVTAEPITIKQLDTAQTLLVKLYHDFIDLYVNQGVSYRNFCRRALRNRCSVAINYKIVTQSVNKVVEAYSRVYDVLTEHRRYVIEAFTRKSGFDFEAALLLLERCESRSRSKDKPKPPSYPDSAEYEALANCANGFDVFSTPISGQDLIDFRDGSLDKPLSFGNVSKAVFFMALLEKLHYLARDWKSRAVTNGMFINAKTGVAPSLSYLWTLTSKNDAGLYLSDTTSEKYDVKKSFYTSITRAVRNAVRT